MRVGALVALASACGHSPAPRTPDSVSVAQTWLEGAPRPARSEPCTIEALAGAPGGEYELLGYVEMHAHVARLSGPGSMIGTSGIGPGPVTHPADLALASPYVCRMGGDSISTASEDESYETSSIDRITLYAVWAKR